jgi:hypothetical protein
MRHPKEGCLLDHGKLDIGGVGAAAASWHLKNRCLNGWHPASKERILKNGCLKQMLAYLRVKLAKCWLAGIHKADAWPAQST